jgi:hypothetical protein
MSGSGGLPGEASEAQPHLKFTIIIIYYKPMVLSVSNKLLVIIELFFQILKLT